MGLREDLTVISLLVTVIFVAAQIGQKSGLLFSTLCNNWSTGQQQLEDYPQRVRALKQRAKEWEEGFKKHGISDIPALASRLKVARKLFEDEKERAENLYSRKKGSSFKRWKRKVASLVFPNELFDGIKKVTDGFEEISGYLEEAVRLHPWLRDFRRWEPAKLNFQKDECYTANKEIEKLVRDQLENKRGGADIVVLNGEPGSGKTSLAKELGLEYEKQSFDLKKDQLEREWLHFRKGQPTQPDHKKRDLFCRFFPPVRYLFSLFDSTKEQPKETDNEKCDSTKDQQEEPGPMFPDGVFFVDCGSGADVTKVYKKLLEDLGIAGPGTSSSEADRAEPPPGKDSLRKELEGGLYELSALIILDNVCDKSILDALIVPKKTGLHRKFLVTTQNENCIPARGDLGFVKMKAMNHETAANLLLRKILNGNIPENDSKEDAENGVPDTSGLENLIGKIKLLPENLTEKMMEHTNCNPQALVCFAELLRERVLSQESYQELVDLDGEFFSTLENEGIAARAGHSSTVIKSMMASVETLSREQPRLLDLLLFLALCDSPVPETVLRSIFCFLDDKQGTVEKTRFTKKRFSLTSSLPILEKWNLIEHYYIEAPGNKRTRESVQVHSGKSRHEQHMFEVSSLRRKIILKEMVEESQSLIRNLLTTKLPDLSADGPTEAYLVAVLCATYGDKTVEELTLGLKEVGLDVDRYSKFRSEFETRKNFVEEAVRLLHSAVGVGEPKRGDQQKDDKNSEEVIQKKEAHKHGKKVIVQVLCEGTVDDGAISELLQLCEPFPSIVLRALKVLLASDSPQIVEGPPVLIRKSDSSWTIHDKMKVDPDAGSRSGREKREILMRGLKPTTLLAYMKDMKEVKFKTPSALIQLKALEVVKEYTDTAEDRRQELAHFVDSRGTGFEKNTIYALFELLDQSRKIEDDVRKVKQTLLNESLTSFWNELMDRLQDLQNLHFDSAVKVAVDVAVNEIEPMVKFNRGGESPPRETLDNLSKTLDEYLDRDSKIRQVSLDILKSIEDFLAEKDMEKYKSYVSKPQELIADKNQVIIMSTSCIQHSTDVGQTGKAEQRLSSETSASSASTSSSP